MRTFAVDTEPLIRDLDPVLDDLQPTLVSLRRLSPDLENLFDNVDPLITAGDDGLPALSRILRGLDPTLAATGPFLQQLNPMLRYLEFNQTKVSDFLSIGGSAIGGIRSAPAGSKSNGHVLPQIIMTGAETLPAATRSKTNRGNAYIRPDAARDGSKFTLPSFDCNHVGEKGPTNTPGCRVQEDVPFEGLSQRFPQVQPGLPGGRLKSARRLTADGGRRWSGSESSATSSGCSSRSSSGCPPPARSSTRARRSPSPRAAARWRRCSSPGSPGRPCSSPRWATTPRRRGRRTALRERFGVELHAAGATRRSGAASRSSTTPASARSPCSASGSCRTAAIRCPGTRSPTWTRST